MKNKEELAEGFCNRVGLSWENDYAKEAWLDGYEAATPEWIKVEKENPDNDRTVLVKVKDYRRPEENVTEVSLGYYDEFKNWRYQCTDNLINSGHGWFIEEWTEIPQ